MRALALACLIIGSIACPGTQQVGEHPSWRKADPGTVQPVTFAPVAVAVSRYNEPIVAPPTSPLGDAVIAAVTKAAQRVGKTPPIADARLFRACAELAEVYPQDGVIGYNLVEFALQRNGIIEPSPRLLVVWGDLDQAEAIVTQLEPQLAEVLTEGAHLRVGVGAAKRNADGTGVIVFALQSSSLSTAPIPRVVPAGGTLALHVTVDPRYREPEVFVTRDDGDTQRLDVVLGAAGAFASELGCGAHKGRQQLEITASDAAGSTVLANFPVWCAAEPPIALEIAPASREDVVQKPTDAEQKLLVLVNRDRAAAGLGQLAWDERVADVARGHSEEMKRTKVVAHVSPTTGSAADRVRVANIKTAVVLENVARAYGVVEAHQALMNSPGHRANLMSKIATTLGVGVVFGEEISGGREMFITQVFTRVPPKIDPTTAASVVAARIIAVHKATASDKLTAIARDVAVQLATGKSRDAVWPGVKLRIDALGNQYQKIGSVITAAADLDALDGKALLGDSLPDDIGVGIAQGTHPEIGDGAIWIVVLMGQRR